MARTPTYPSDLTDAQWEIIEPMLPLIKEPGRPPKHPRRDIVNAILYVVRTGCPWRQLPVDFPPWQTVYGQFRKWEKQQVTDRIVQVLREEVRLQAGREAQPSAGRLPVRQGRRHRRSRRTGLPRGQENQRSGTVHRHRQP